MTITENELLDALRNVLNTAPPEQDGFTTQDVMAALSVGSVVARRAMKSLLENGQAVSVRITRSNMFGHPHVSYGLRLK